MATEASRRQPQPLAGQRNEPWSRTAGTLAAEEAEGWRQLRRLQSLRILLVGSGRTGSILAEQLTLLGASLTLIDADVLEKASFSEASALFSVEEDLGRPKAVALLERLKSRARPGSHHSAHAFNINHPESLRAAKETDLIVVTSDHDAARMAANFIAMAFLKPIIDLGTGISFAPDGQRTMGADLRIGLPGEACLSCLGGFTDPRGAIRFLSSDPSEQSLARRQTDWRSQRSGSLRSLNLLVTGLAARLLEDFVLGRVQRSRWVRVEFAEDGQMTVSSPQGEIGRSNCKVCQEISGAGDAAFGLSMGNTEGKAP